MKFSGNLVNCLVFLVLLICSSVTLAGEADPVGEMTTVIGVAHVTDLAGHTKVAERGMPVHVGDRIETELGGHVHLRFVDGGLVSVRPGSRLVIEAYRNATASAPAAIKFRLEEGVMRSVTGRWGQVNKDRFRLNTPIAAIGVKGTDFVVRVQGADAQAAVFSGAIVMAPLEGDCAATLGPCGGERAVQLTADMQGTMLEYRKTDTRPRLVPLVDLLGASGNSPSGPSRLEQYAKAGDTGQKPALNEARAAEAVPGKAVLAQRPLVWLHNAAGWNVPEKTISERFSEARAAGLRATVGNFFFTLYRDETTLTDFQPVGAAASFRLGSASAVFNPPVATGRPSEAVSVANGSLEVDFARSTFATSLDLTSPSLGQVPFSAAGRITPEGYFVARGDGQHLAGAFSMDGREAGYLFNKVLPSGQVSGLTLWRR